MAYEVLSNWKRRHSYNSTMRYHLFLHYGWFLQNLGKDFIRTNMHTTVGSKELGIYELESCPIFIGIFFAQFNQIWNITNVIVLWFVLLLSPWTLITTLIMQSYIVFDMQWFLGGIWKQSFPSRKPFWLQPQLLLFKYLFPLSSIL